MQDLQSFEKERDEWLGNMETIGKFLKQKIQTGDIGLVVFDENAALRRISLDKGIIRLIKRYKDGVFGAFPGDLYDSTTGRKKVEGSSGDNRRITGTSVVRTIDVHRRRMRVLACGQDASIS
ncbi:MAG: hypothetical protein A2Z25_24340 [Planctomycetes bacterium RBG_16_55_9]|nr:MAG: hypothetical protein A2Z25_24340 [Planctomycetes bacterium RBG_16_55_9]